MLVENAIKHNEMSKEHPLEIIVEAGEDQRLVVRNPIRLKASSEPSPGLGLENLQKRIAILSDEALSIISGVESERCGRILTEFFQKKRAEGKK